MVHLSKTQIKWVRSLQNKKTRDAMQLFVAEGTKCVEELEKSFTLRLKVTPENATSSEISQMSSLRTPQGVIAVFEQKQIQPIDLSTKQLVLALDGIQDPGNLGTIIRTCDWFGIHHIICSSNTADCYNPKVVQATMGALSRVGLHYVDDLSAELLRCILYGYPIYGTLLDGKNIYSSDAIVKRNYGVIVMGNEGNGISESVREIITHSLYVPSYSSKANTSESLNVGIATAIVLAEFRRIEASSSKLDDQELPS